jgi:hypothetical protein
VQTSENHRSGELKELGWSPEDCRKYEELWEYRHRWGAINLEREDRIFLRKAEAALPKIVTGKAEKKKLQDKSYYRWLAFYRDAMASSDSAAGLGESEVAAWPILLQEELRAIDYYQPVLGLPDTLKAKELQPLREQWVSQQQAVRVANFDFNAPLEELKSREKTSWKPLRGDDNSDSSYPVLDGAAAESFRLAATEQITSSMRALFPSLKTSEES